MAIQSAYGFRLMEVNHPLELCDLPALEPAADEVIVAVAGCGVCHTDVGYAYDGVQTRHARPLVLGHEITGRVVAAGDKAGHWLGRAVIVPAVISCGECAACAHADAWAKETRVCDYALVIGWKQVRRHQADHIGCRHGRRRCA